MEKRNVASWSLVLLVVMCLELYGYAAVEATMLGRTLGNHHADIDKQYQREHAKEAADRVELTTGGYGHYGGSDGSGFGSGSRDEPKYGYGAGGGGGYGPGGGNGGGFDAGNGVGGGFRPGGRYGSGGGQNGGWDGGNNGPGGESGYGSGRRWRWGSGSERGSEGDGGEGQYGFNSPGSLTTGESGKDKAADSEQP